MIKFTSIIIALLVSININAGENVNVDAYTEIIPNVINTNGGRYAFGLVNNNVFMLDTETGQLWILEKDNSGRKHLEPVPYLKHLKSKNANMFKLTPENK